VDGGIQYLFPLLVDYTLMDGANMVNWDMGTLRITWLLIRWKLCGAVPFLWWFLSPFIAVWIVFLFHLIEILDPISLWEGFKCMVKQDRHGRHLPPVVGFICLWRIVLSTSAFNIFFCCYFVVTCYDFPPWSRSHQVVLKVIETHCLFLWHLISSANIWSF
jgi:hypothetical protein